MWLSVAYRYQCNENQPIIVSIIDSRTWIKIFVLSWNSKSYHWRNTRRNDSFKNYFSWNHTLFLTRLSLSVLFCQVRPDSYDITKVIIVAIATNSNCSASSAVTPYRHFIKNRILERYMLKRTPYYTLRRVLCSLIRSIAPSNRERRYTSVTSLIARENVCNEEGRFGLSRALQNNRMPVHTDENICGWYFVLTDKLHGGESLRSRQSFS
jgi:hypothetical protein